MTTMILGLGGSLRSGSITSMALNVALMGAEEAGASTQFIDLATLKLPLFDGTYSIDGYTTHERESIMNLITAIEAADGVVLASPTYHNSMSGALKNALDLLEVLNENRPSRLKGKVVGIAAVQGGNSGTGINTLTTMLLASRAMGAWVAPTMVSIPGSHDAFDVSSRPIDRSIDLRLRALGTEVAKASALFRTLYNAE